MIGRGNCIVFGDPKRRNVSLLSFMNDRKDADMYYGWQKELIGRGNCFWSTRFS